VSFVQSFLSYIKIGYGNAPGLILLIALGMFWSAYRHLKEPYKIDLMAESRFHFVGILSSTTIEPGTVSEIRAAHITIWSEDEPSLRAIKIVHSGGRLVVRYFDGIGELIAALKEANPLALVEEDEVRGDRAPLARRRGWVSVALSLLGFGAGYLYMGRPVRGVVAGACILVLAVLYQRSAPAFVDASMRSMLFAAIAMAGAVFLVLDTVLLARRQSAIGLRWYNSWFLYLVWITAGATMVLVMGRAA
jgi:hypothetical protein